MKSAAKIDILCQRRAQIGAALALNISNKLERIGLISEPNIGIIW